jgi:hypothetical protein
MRFSNIIGLAVILSNAKDLFLNLVILSEATKDLFPGLSF